MNYASTASKLVPIFQILFSSGIPTHDIASKANRYEMLMRFKRQSVREKLHTLKFIFNCHVKTVALIICFKNLFVQVCAVPEVVSKPAVVVGPLTLEFQHVTLATRSEVCTEKVKYVYASTLKRNEIEPLIIISSHDFHLHSNNHSLMAEPGEGPGGSYPPPLVFRSTETRRTEKKRGDRASPLSQGLDDRPRPFLIRSSTEIIKSHSLNGMSKRSYPK